MLDWCVSLSTYMAALLDRASQIRQASLLRGFAHVEHIHSIEGAWGLVSMELCSSCGLDSRLQVLPAVQTTYNSVNFVHRTALET